MKGLQKSLLLAKAARVASRWGMLIAVALAMLAEWGIPAGAQEQKPKRTVIRAGRDWEVLAVNDMDDEVYATPAPVDGRLYLRTKSALYCFGNKQ